jgi:hypothetical protein
MRWFVAFTILFVAACFERVTATQEDPPADAYTLKSVDLDSLPAPAGGSSGSRWVLSGSLTLQPDGYYILSERDSIWNGRAFTREEETEGGTWIADGSMLMLSDTTTGMIDTYGAAAPTYYGSIAPHAVLLTIPTEDGTETHVYRYGLSNVLPDSRDEIVNDREIVAVDDRGVNVVAHDDRSETAERADVRGNPMAIYGCSLRSSGCTISFGARVTVVVTMSLSYEALTRMSFPSGTLQNRK